MTMRKLCILCCFIAICCLVCFAASADVVTPGIDPLKPHFPNPVRDLIQSDLRALWGAIVAAALAVAAFFTRLFHKK